MKKWTYLIFIHSLWCLEGSAQINIAPTFNVDSINVRLVGRWACGPCYAVAIEGDIVYFGNGGYLEIIDFSKPNWTVEKRRILLQGRVNDIVIKGSYAYIANCGGFNIVDIYNPDEPKIVSNLQGIDFNCYGIDIVGDYAFISIYGYGLKIVNISNPRNIFIEDSLIISGFHHNIKFYDNKKPLI